MKYLNLPSILGFAKKLINRKVIIGLIVLWLILFIGNRNAQDTSKIQLYTVSPKTINTTVTASGTVQANQSSNLHFQAAGQLAWVGVKQGDHVNKGQAIASLNTQVLQKQLQTDLNNYEKQFSTFDDTKDTYKDDPLTAAIKRIAQRSQADLNNSVIDVEIQNLAIQFSTITSPIDGYIIDKPAFYPGSNVLTTDTIATVATTKDMQFVAQADETDIGSVRTGQEASISLDAYPDNTFNSTVALISPDAVTTSTGSTAFNVTLDLGNSDQTPFLIGMNGSAEITTQTRDNVLSVPLEAIINDNNVWVKNGNKYSLKKVSLGLETDTDAEITSGLSKGDVVVTAGFDQLNKASIFQKIRRLFSR